MGTDGLVVRGRSDHHRRDGRFTLGIALAFVPLQLIAVLLQWTDSWFLPFGLCTAAAGAIAAAILLRARSAPCCRDCGAGLAPDRYVEVSSEAYDPVAAALASGDGAALAGAVQAHPRLPEQTWHRLGLEYCPRCWQVVVARLEGRRSSHRGAPAPVVIGGEGARAVLEISEIDLG